MEATPEYEALINLVKNRMSVRGSKFDPVPDEHIERVLEAGRWVMSGANSQPWGFIVVKDAEKRAQLYEAYRQNERVASESEAP